MDKYQVERILDDYADTLEEFMGLTEKMFNEIRKMSGMLDQIDQYEELKKSIGVKSQSRNIEANAKEFIRLLPQLEKQLQELSKRALNIRY